MTDPKNFRELLGELAHTPLSGTWGSRLVGAVALLTDACEHAASCAVRASWIKDEFSPDDALPLIGSERLMEKYPAETMNAYRDRLAGAWDAWDYAGDESAIESQFEAAGYVADEAVLDGLTGWTPNAYISMIGGQADSDGETSAALLTDTNDSGVQQHYVSASASSIEPGVVDFEAVIKAGTLDWVFLSRGGSGWAYFGQGTGATGTEGAVATARITAAKTPGWWRCRLRFVSTTSTKTLYILTATADGTNNYQGDGTGTLYAHAVRCGSPRVQVYTAQDWADRPPTPHWSQFWVVLPKTTHTAGAARKWGDGLKWGAPSVWGSDLTAAEALTVRRIARKWKPGHWVCREVIFQGDAELWGTGIKWGTGVKWGAGSVSVGVQAP